jgi:hypothetical protein
MPEELSPAAEIGFTAEALAGSLSAQQDDTLPVDTPAEAAPAPAPEPAEAAAQLDFRNAMKERGYDPSQFETDEALVDHLVEQARVSARVPQLEQAARYVEYLSPYAEEIDKLVQSKQQPAVEPTPAEEHYWGTPPEWDPTWEQYLETDAAGKVTTSPNSPSPNLHHKYIARRDWERQKASVMLTDPVAAIRPGLQKDFDAIKEEARKIAREEITAMRQDQQANSFAVANQEWLYQQGADGQPMIDPASHQPVFSPRGVTFVQIAQELQRTGMDPNQIPLYALRMLPPENAQQTAPTPAAPALAPAPAPAPPVANEMKEQFLAGFTPPRGGASIASAAQPHAPFLGPDEDAVALLGRAFKTAGLSGSEM